MMMWVFAVLVVLAMGVIAMLAAGRGEPMRPAYDDRPDSLVPADRPLAADDLRRVRFPMALRGYRMSEVDALLDRLAGELDVRSAGTADPGAETTAGSSTESTTGPTAAESADPASRPPGSDRG